MKSKDVTGSTDVNFGLKDRKDATFYYSFYLLSEELISTDQFMQTYFTVFGLCQALIFNVTFQGKYFWKHNLVQHKNLLTCQERFSQFCHFWRYFRDMLSVSTSLMLHK